MNWQGTIYSVLFAVLAACVVVLALWNLAVISQVTALRAAMVERGELLIEQGDVLIRHEKELGELQAKIR